MTLVVENPYAPPTEEVPSGRGRRRAPDSRPPTGRRPPARVRAPLPPRPPMPMWATVLTPAIAMLAVLCAWFLLQVLALGGLEQARAQQVLRADLREQLAAQTAPTGGAIKPGAPVALLEVPTLGLEQVVVEGTAASDLMAGPGHLRKTVLPGQEGRSMIYGRAATYGAPFRSVPNLRAGDGITVTTAQGEFVYRVDGVRREGDPLPLPPGDGVGQLVLVTAEGTGPLAALTPHRTVYIDATLVGEAVGAPAGRPGSVPEAEKPLRGDPSALPVLAVGLQGLLVALVGVLWALRRHPRATVWLLGSPVLVTMAWLSTDAAVQLLPNLL